MRLDARDLVNTAVGRQLCLAYVETLVDQHRVHKDLGPVEQFSKALKTAAMVLDLESGGSSVIGWDIDGQMLEHESFLASLKVEATELGVLGAAAASTLASLLDQVPLTPMCELTTMQVLAHAVSQMHFWGQHPGGEERLASHPHVRRSLLRVADHIVTSEATSWWYAPWAPTDQWLVKALPAPYDDPDKPEPLVTLEQHESLAILLNDAFELIESERDARTRRYSNPLEKLNGVWWSFPPYALAKSTRMVADIGPIGVYCEEDGRGESTKVAWRVDPVGTEIFEVRNAQDWSTLCALYPNDVSASRQDMWHLNTGRVGRWVIPDWVAMANDYDGIHLSVAAYLSLAGTVIQVPELDFTGDWASSITGWTPDWTFYFTPVRVDQGSRERWYVGDSENGLEVWQRFPHSRANGLEQST